jgi:hypothetical protein
LFYHGSPQTVVYEPKEDPYPVFQPAQPLLKYHLIHQSYPSTPVKIGEREEASILASPAASPSTNHRGSIIPAFIPGNA